MKKENEETRYGLWQDRLRKSDARMQQRIQEWDRYMAQYRMDESFNAQLGTRSTDDLVWTNYFFAYSRVILPSIYYRNPEILVSPGPNTEPVFAKIVEMLLNWQARELGFEWEARRAIFNALFRGVGVIKQGFAPRLLEKPKRSTARESILEGMFEEPPELEDYDPRISDTIPFLLNISPKHFRVDPLATCLQDARWIAHTVWKTVDEVKESARYSKSLTAGIQATHRGSDEAYANQDPTPALSGNSFTSDDELVCLYEIWDMEKRKLYVMDSHNIRQGSKKFLREEAWPYPIKEFPFELLIFNPDPESIWGIPDAATWLNPIVALNYLRTMRFRHVRRFNRKYVASKGAFDDGELAKLTSHEDGSIAFTNRPSPMEAIQPLTDATVTPDLYALEDSLRSDLLLLSGMTEGRTGKLDRTKTATEASILESKAQIRDSDRLYLVSKFVENIFRKQHQFNKAYLDPQEVSFLTVPEAALLWREESDKILNAELDVRVRIGSSGYFSREVRTKQHLDFLNLTLGDPMVNRPVLLRRIAEGMDIEAPQEILNEQPLFTLEQAAQILAQGQPTQPQARPVGGKPNPSQGMARRTGGSNMGDMLSGVQNLGVRRTPPNPTQELAGG